ncbi:MAG TPA: hypothetical protein VNK96_10130 [Fimbriimonadales bacterium]|nr:hypothetical protein [Fimbriimonadales bacterium]
MKKSPVFWALVIGGICILLVLAVNVVLILMKPNDEAQIREAIEEMRKASLEHRPGGVLERLSNQFRLPEPYSEEVPNPRYEVSRFIREAKITKLEIKVNSIEISGDSAIAKCRLTTDLTFRGIRFNYDGPAELEFQRETKRRLFIIPEPVWLMRGGTLDPSQIDIFIF